MECQEVELIEAVERAFANTSLGDGVSLYEAEVIDDHGSREERALAHECDEARGWTSDWRNIPELALEEHDWNYVFMDAAGIRFHLPAYICFALRRLNDPDPPDSAFAAEEFVRSGDLSISLH